MTLGVYLRSAPFLIVLMALCGALMLIPAIYASGRADHVAARAFFYSALLCFIVVGMVLIATAHRQNARRSTGAARRQLAIFVAGYAFLPLIFAVPLLQIMPHFGLATHWVEMISCFTTTGSSFYGETPPSPATTALWRAMVGWLGGLYLLSGMVAILAPNNLGGIEVLSGRHPAFLAEGYMQATQMSAPNARFYRTLGVLAQSYGGLTLVLWLLLVAAGEGTAGALIRAMSILSTSGISGSQPVSGGIWAEFAVFAFLLLALTHRAMPRMRLNMAQGALRYDREVMLGFIILGFVTSVLMLRHWSGFAAQVGPYVGLEGSFRAALSAFWGALFTTLSFLTTTGEVSAHWGDVQNWSGLSQSGLVFAGLALVGGGVATTAGGVKLLRVYALARYGERELQRLIHPSSIGGAGMDARRLRRSGAYYAWLFFMLFALALAVITLLLTLLGQTFEDALVLALSALSNTGPLTQVAGQNPVALAELTLPVKLLLALFMVIGRLEVLVIVALFAPQNWRR